MTIPPGASTWAIAIGAVALLSGSLGYCSGRDRSADVAKAALEREYAAADALRKAEEKIRDVEAKHRVDVEALESKYTAESAAAQEQDAHVIASLRGSVASLRLRVKTCSSSSTNGGSSSASSKFDDSGRAELEAATSAALWAIAADGDRAIRKLTALQEWARMATKLCGGADGTSLPTHQF